MGLNYANRFLHNLLERCALDILYMGPFYANRKSGLKPLLLAMNIMNIMNNISKIKVQDEQYYTDYEYH